MNDGKGMVMEQKNLTIESIREAVEKCSSIEPADHFYPTGWPQRWLGVNILEAPARVVPKIKLGDSAPVSDEFRADFNAWLVQMFGTIDVSPVRPGMAYLFGNNILIRPESVVYIGCCA